MIQLGCREAAEHGPKIVNIYRAEVNSLPCKSERTGHSKWTAGQWLQKARSRPDVAPDSKQK
jgi:hypothetical protein